MRIIAWVKSCWTLPEAHVHIKNAEWAKTGQFVDGSAEWKASWSPLGQGIMNWKQVLNDLQVVGYDGYLGVEDFSLQHDSRTLLTQLCE